MENTRKFPLILSSFWLKVLALLTMTIDHVGYLLADYNYDVSNVFRYIGRLALPLFCFMITEGAIHTKSFKKYALRLGIMASLISLTLIFVEYVPGFNSMREQGIIFLDLLLGALAVYLLRQKKWYIKLLAILPLLYGIGSFIASSLEWCRCNGYIIWFPFFMRTQYGWYAILTIILFYVAHLLANLFIKYLSGWMSMPEEYFQNSSIQRHALNLISVLMLIVSSFAFYICGKMMPSRYVSWDVSMQLFAVVSGAFILLYSGLRGYNKKWFQYGSYLYYPLHMIVLYLIFSFI